MGKMRLILAYMLVSLSIFGQGQWRFTKLTNMPIASSDNAVCEAVFSNGSKFVYSFGGVRNPLGEDAIHREVQKYTVSTNSWSIVASIPDSLGKLGASASYVNNRIYLIGGHYSLDDSTITSNRMHVFNPFIDTFEVDGANLPISTDYHVQSVWRDSLIYVIGGWSDTSTTTAVQIYNPYFNSWEMGTSLPDDVFFKSFGSSGVILGDTIFYFGGTFDGLENGVSSGLRKGVINPENPTEITWEFVGSYSNSTTNKAVCAGHGDKMFVFGGSEYQFNYKGEVEETAVQPFVSQRILNFSVISGVFTLSESVDFPVGRKGSRGLAKLGGGNWITCGGIDSLQEASRSVYLLTNFSFSDIDKALQPPIFDVVEFDEYYLVKTENVGTVSVYDVSGRTLFSKRKSLADLIISKSDLEVNMLIFVYNDGSNVPVTRKRVMTH